MKRQPHAIDLHDAAYVAIALVVFLAFLGAILAWSARPAGALPQVASEERS